MSPNSFNAKVFKGSPNGRILEGVQSYDLKENDVLIHIEYCGLCYTDVHYKAQDMVLGHEGVGKIEAVGSGVNDFKKGDRVGWGYVHNVFFPSDGPGNNYTNPDCRLAKSAHSACRDRKSIAPRASCMELMIMKRVDFPRCAPLAPSMCSGFRTRSLSSTPLR